jgi:hypothetical protein
MDALDRVSSKGKDYNFTAIAKLPHQHMAKEVEGSGKTLASGTAQLQTHSAIAKSNTGILLNPIFPQSRSHIFQSKLNSITEPSSEVSSYAPITHSSRFSSLAATSYSYTEPSRNVINTTSSSLSTQPLVRQLFTRSELLGGALTLKDLSEPSMPPLARAERAKWSRTGDPLAPLPQLWREPMRKALSALTIEPKSSVSEGITRKTGNATLDDARIIHVPSSTVRRSVEVPLALQADGTVDILNQPDDPAVVDEIKRWSVKQKPPAPGRVSPAVVHLHAFPQTPPTTIGTAVKGSTATTTPSLTNSLSQPVSAKATPARSETAVSPLPSSSPIPSSQAPTPAVTSSPAPSAATQATISPPPQPAVEPSGVAELTSAPSIPPNQPAPVAEAGQ